jgi:hypothetical protein
MNFRRRIIRGDYAKASAFDLMADIFVSYAKTDRPLALKLASMLEAEGWKTWWDTSLTIGDDFRNEIMTELGRARAVIVIWTDASIKSDWVRSEAGRAQADRKLIPVKLEHLTYKDLPPPFDVLHTENVGEEDKIRAAVVAQLAKPAVEPSAVALLTKGFKYEVLTWFGIVGGALTLFGNLDAVLKLADWARVLVEHWKEWTHEFWVWAFGWLGIHLPPEWTPVLSFLLFGSLLAIGQAVKFNTAITDHTIEDKYNGKSFQLTSWRTISSVVVMVLCLLLWLRYVIYNVKDIMFTDLFGNYELTPIMLIARYAGDWSFPVLMALWVLIIVLPLPLVILFARFRLYATVAIVLMVIFWTIISFTQVMRLDFLTLNAPLLVASMMIPVLSLVLLSVAPAKAISRRLIFLALGLLLLIVLNELSKLGLDVTAPKLQG